MAQQFEAVVIGAGQAGLAISYFLTQQGRSHVVLEKAKYVASAWRDRRWDSFTLVTPNWTVRLPGFPYRGSNPDGFMNRAEIALHFEQYAARFRAPVRFETQVTAVDLAPNGNGYLASTANSDTYAAKNVIIATGFYQCPRPTSFSIEFPRNIVQLHSSQYRNANILPPGSVLVVGGSESGCQIAEELNDSGRQVYLCVGRSVRRPRRYRGKDFMFWAEALGRLDATVDQLPSPSARFAPGPTSTGKNGGRTINLHHCAQNGIVLLGHLVSVHDSRIELAPDLDESLAAADRASDDFKKEVDEFVIQTRMDVLASQPDPIDEVRSDAGSKAPTTLDLRAAGITAVIWANGYSYDYSWVHLPVLDSLGFPIQKRGVTKFPGLYFLGMHLLYKRKSGILLGVGEDAAYIAEVIDQLELDRSLQSP